MSGATGARLVAALGAVCAIGALWTNAGALGSGASAYFDDGTLGGVMLAAAVVVLLLLLAAERSGRRVFDLAGVVVGALLFGLLLFNPVFWAPHTLGHLGAAAWLGLCSALVPLALLALPPAVEPSSPPAATRIAAAACGAAGVVLAVVGATRGGGVFSARTGYWDPLVRPLGICLIVLVVLAGFLLAASLARPAPFAADAALAFAAAAVGFAAYVPVSAAFDRLGALGDGAWLSLGGAVLLVVGVLLGRSSLPRQRVAVRASH